MRRLCTIGEFAKLADARQRDSEVGISTVSIDQPEFSETGRIVTYTFSTGSVGRDFHTVAPDAWQTRNFENNPVFLWAHDDSQPPIGRVVSIGDVGGKLKGQVEYAGPDLSSFADMIYRMVKAKYLNAVSTSWMPLAWSRSTDRSRPGGIDFKSVELLEISQVPIPALPAALAEARSAGIDTTPMVEWAERLLDRAGMLLVPRNELETLRRAAKMPTARKNTGDGLLVGKHRRAIESAPKVPAFKRGLYDVAQLAYALSTIGYCHDSAEYEAALEEDNSPVPAMLGEALKALGEALIAMTEEEVKELLAEHDGDEDSVEESRSLALGERAYVAGGKSPQSRAWRLGIALARAGRSLSSSNEKRLKEVAGHHDRAMKHHRAMDDHHKTLGDHIDDAQEHHERMTSTLNELGEHVRAAHEAEDPSEHLDAAGKSLRAAEKHASSVADAHGKVEESHEDLGDSHQALGRSVKRAQTGVRSVLKGADTSEPDSEGDSEIEDDQAAKEQRARRARALQLKGSVA